jgi:hypothetical protein
MPPLFEIHWTPDSEAHIARHGVIADEMVEAVVTARDMNDSERRLFRRMTRK